MELHEPYSSQFGSGSLVRVAPSVRNVHEDEQHITAVTKAKALASSGQCAAKTQGGLYVYHPAPARTQLVLLSTFGCITIRGII